MHSQFVNPTRERLKGLLHGTMGLTAGLYIVLALCGYLYAYGDTKVSRRRRLFNEFVLQVSAVRLYFVFTSR